MNCDRYSYVNLFFRVAQSFESYIQQTLYRIVSHKRLQPRKKYNLILQVDLSVRERGGVGSLEVGGVEEGGVYLTKRR
jgi:hypothetical protein